MSGSTIDCVEVSSLTVLGVVIGVVMVVKSSISVTYSSSDSSSASMLSVIIPSEHLLIHHNFNDKKFEHEKTCKNNQKILQGESEKKTMFFLTHPVEFSIGGPKHPTIHIPRAPWNWFCDIWTAPKLSSILLLTVLTSTMFEMESSAMMLWRSRMKVKILIMLVLWSAEKVSNYWSQH